MAAILAAILAAISVAVQQKAGLSMFLIL